MTMASQFKELSFGPFEQVPFRLTFFRCLICGALVTGDDREQHVIWHLLLRSDFNEVAPWMNEGENIAHVSVETCAGAEGGKVASLRENHPFGSIYDALRKTEAERDKFNASNERLNADHARIVAEKDAEIERLRETLNIATQCTACPLCKHRAIDALAGGASKRSSQSTHQKESE